MSYNQFDITLKNLVQPHPEAWAAFAGADPECSAEVINAEISTLEARADAALKIRDRRGEWILYLEFQADHKSELLESVHYKSVALRRVHNKLVKSVIVLLRKDAKAKNLTGILTLQFPDESQPYEVFRYHIMRLWEHSLASLLSGNAALLPLATLTDEAKPRISEVLAKIDARIRNEVSLEEADKLREATVFLMGLRYPPALIHQLAKGVLNMVLESSSIYQEALSKGEARGEARGNASGRVEEAIALVNRLLTKRFGSLPSSIPEQINGMTVEQIEQLAEELLDFGSLDDLLKWMAKHKLSN